MVSIAGIFRPHAGKRYLITHMARCIVQIGEIGSERLCQLRSAIEGCFD